MIPGDRGARLVNKASRNVQELVPVMVIGSISSLGHFINLAPLDSVDAYTQ